MEALAPTEQCLEDSACTKQGEGGTAALYQPGPASCLLKPQGVYGLQAESHLPSGLRLDGVVGGTSGGLKGPWGAEAAVALEH